MRFLICSLFLCCTASAQPFLSFKDSSVIGEIDLPAKEPFDSSNTFKKAKGPYVYISSDNDLYDLFDWSIAVKYRDFDFTNYHILGQQVCRQCLQFCHHDEGETSCHRNRCNFEWVWQIRDNKKAFTEIPSSHLASPSEYDLSWRKEINNDTVVTSAGKAVWYTTGRGDCLARFSYKLYTDRYYPVLLLKEWNYWGGCRAGGVRNFQLSFSMPEGVLYKIKNTVLVN